MYVLYWYVVIDTLVVGRGDNNLRCDPGLIRNDDCNNNSSSAASRRERVTAEDIPGKEKKTKRIPSIGIERFHSPPGSWG